MPRFLAIVLAVMVLFGSPRGAAAQAPSTVAPPTFVSPELRPDRTVVFRLWAPKASEVAITGDFLILPNHSTLAEQMVKDSQGIWTFTTPPLTPDEYSYAFLVDGLRLLDPLNGQIRRGQRRQQSSFSVPGPEADYLALKPVPHGQIRTVLLDSPLEGQTRGMVLYLPPGYDLGHQRYPLLVLTHGGGEDAWGWTDIGRLNLILDNLIADGKARPMIVAMPSLGAANPLTLPGAHQPEYELLARILRLEILPYCERNLRLLPGSANRALGGLGVGRDMLPSLLWPSLKLFDWIGFAAGGTDPNVFEALQKKYSGALDDPANTRRVKFFLANGSNDSSVTATRFLAAELQKRGYKTTLALDNGIHEWPAFRRHFAAFAQHLFH